jgi:hypothetical protein
MGIIPDEFDLLFYPKIPEQISFITGFFFHFSTFSKKKGYLLNIPKSYSSCYDNIKKE